MAADNRSVIELPALNLEDVLLKLPLPSLLVCCCVSKSLLNLIKSDSGFARVHFAESESQLLIHSLSRSNVHLIDVNADANPPFAERVEINPSFNLPLFGFEVTHSCNGLVLLENFNMDDEIHRCVVFNPVTGEYITLPDTTVLSRHVTSAFFYCPVKNQFKIFRAFHRVYRLSPDSFPPMEFEIFLDGNYSHDSDSDTDPEHAFDSDSNYSESDRMGEFIVGGYDFWEPLDNLPFSPQALYSPCNLNNATHWLCADQSVQNLIVSFNFETGQFGEITTPGHMTKMHANLPDHVNLVLLDGFLTIFDNYTDNARFDVWKMKEYGVVDSWTIEFVIDISAWGVYGCYYSFTPVICRNNGEVVMVCGSGYILFYDLLKKVGRIVYHPELKHPSIAVAHTPRLMSLRDVTRGTNMVVQNVSPRFAQPEENTRKYLVLSATFSEREAADC